MMDFNNKRFDIQLNKVKALLGQAQKEEDPGLYLYKNDLRTPFFQLEGLSRIYAFVSPQRKKFARLRDKFKKLEDLLGEVDHYAVLAREFEHEQKIPHEIKQYFFDKEKESLRLLNRVLKTKKWINGKQIDKIEAFLKEAKWGKEKEQTKQLENLYQYEIEKITQFINDSSDGFTDIEEGIHELRRKLRWLSIYAQAVQGGVELTAEKSDTSHLKKYLTIEIINSPFNQLPVSNDEKVKPLRLSKNNFLALSWMIRRLGELKDEGLNLLALVEAIQSIHQLNEEQAMKTAHEYVGDKMSDPESLLKEANQLTAQFMKDKVLQNLIK